MQARKFIEEHKFEIAVLVLFVLAWTLRANVDGLFLDYPGTVKAADPMYHTMAAQYIIDSGRYGYLPPYLAQGWNNMIDPGPALNYLTTAPISRISGLPVWVVMYLLVTLFESFGVVLLYLLCARIFDSKPVGLLASALYVIPFGIKDWWYGMYIGLWNNVGGFFFFYASLWLAYEYWKNPTRWNIFALSLTVAATWLIHVAELFITGFAVGFVGLRVLLWVRPWKEKIVHSLLLGTVPAVSVILFYPRYKELTGFLTVGSGGSGAFFGWYYPKLLELPFYTSLSNFPWLLLVIAALGLVQIAINWRKYAPLIVGNAYLFSHLFIFPWFLSAYYFFVRQRMSLPFLIAPLVAYGTYHFIVRQLSSLTKVREGVYLVLAIVAVLVLAWPQYAGVAQIKEQQHLTPDKYAALQWLQQHTPEDSEVFFLDGYYQMSDSYAKRVAFDLDLPDLVPVLQNFASSNGSLVTQFDRVGSAGNTEMARTAVDTGSFFTYGRVERRSPIQNITTFDYVVTADFPLGQQPIVQAFNARMAEHLINEYGWKVVYNNNGIRIIQRGGSSAA